MKNSLSTRDDIGKTGQVLLLSLDHQLHEESYGTQNQRADPGGPLTDINEAHSRALTEPFRNYSYSY